MKEPQYLISDGISNGKTWATYYRKPSGSLRRVVSDALPLRENKAEAELDLAKWLKRKELGLGK